MGDRIITLNQGRADNVNAGANSIYEGTGDQITESNFYNQGRLSYLVLPIDTKIDSMRYNYSRTQTTQINLEFWAEIGRVMMFDPKSGAPVVSYI